MVGSGAGRGSMGMWFRLCCLFVSLASLRILGPSNISEPRTVKTVKMCETVCAEVKWKWENLPCLPRNTIYLQPMVAIWEYWPSAVRSLRNVDFFFFFRCEISQALNIYFKILQMTYGWANHICRLDLARATCLLPIEIDVLVSTVRKVSLSSSHYLTPCSQSTWWQTLQLHFPDSLYSVGILHSLRHILPQMVPFALDSVPWL